MPEVFVARQPIYDRRGRVMAYELLFRDGPDEAARIVDGDRATSSVVVATVLELGIERVVGERPAHLNVTRRFLLEQHALALPADRVVLELVEPEPADEPLLTVVERMVERGYQVALCGTRWSEAIAPLAERVTMIKLDVQACGSDLAAETERFRVYGVPLVAEKVENHDERTWCRELGFDGFQGWFFHKPDLVRGRSLPASRIGDLRSLAGLYSPSATFEELEEIIARDVGLSYRLLRYLNSAFLGLPRKVSCVREALALLGARQVRRWAALLTLSGIEGKPHDLLVTALVRARMCEELARTIGRGDTADAAFTTGLFSVMDALADAPLEEVLANLPLADEIVAALRDGADVPGALLSAVVAYERGDPDAAEAALPAQARLAPTYLDALAWSEAALTRIAP